MTTFIDLGAGIGGMRLAFEQAGAKSIYAIERDHHACMTYAENFGEWVQGDLYRTQTQEIPDHDILVSGFPCQPWSKAGKMRGLVDKKNGHFFYEILRILRARQPAAFLLENVNSLENHRNFVFMMTRLMRAGYAVSYNVLNSSPYVPQNRSRLFIVGFRQPNPMFDWPEAPYPRQTHLYHILEPEVDGRYLVSDKVLAYRDTTVLDLNTHNFDQCTRTLTSRYGKDGKEILILDHRYGRPRRLTPRECARLMGFPDSFKIPVSDYQAYKQFGNSVVVPLVAAIARSMSG